MRESVLTFVLAALLRQLNIDRREFWAMIYAYPCQLIPNEDGGLVATPLDVPEAITGGSDRAEALTMVEDALATALAGYVDEKRDIRGRQTRPVFRYEGAAVSPRWSLPTGWVSVSPLCRS